jgi:hypothetical protein
MTIHVLGHARETPSMASADWRAGRAVAGRGRRAAIVIAALGLGILLGLWSTTWNLHR